MGIVSVETDPYLVDITERGAGWTMDFALVADIGAVRRDLDTVDIVIYEEDSLTRALLYQWLGEAGYRVRIGMPRVTDPDRAALVIVNVFMPKHAGAQWIRSIQAAHPNTPLIAISGQFRSGLSAAGATAQTLGVRKVIAKPLVRTDLLDAVRGIIGAPD
jgi:DNA-binding NtrC family response regulator